MGVVLSEEMGVVLYERGNDCVLCGSGNGCCVREWVLCDRVYMCLYQGIQCLYSHTHTHAGKNTHSTHTTPSTYTHTQVHPFNSSHTQQKHTPTKHTTTKKKNHPPTCASGPINAMCSLPTTRRLGTPTTCTNDTLLPNPTVLFDTHSNAPSSPSTAALPAVLLCHAMNVSRSRSDGCTPLFSSCISNRGHVTSEGTNWGSVRSCRSSGEGGSRGPERAAGLRRCRRR